MTGRSEAWTAADDRSRWTVNQSIKDCATVLRDTTTERMRCDGTNDDVTMTAP